ncbi:hypothetical protein H4R35_002120 [Dimargaris xerosporica]|nr:hypothetical protein H4R35_002120 [Dimargaris xerosporica]
MTDRLPAQLLRLFAPRPPLPHVTPLDRDPAKRAGPTLSGIGDYVSVLREAEVKAKADEATTEPKPLTRAEKMAQRKRLHDEQIQVATKAWNPEQDPNVQGDAYKTIMVGRLSYDTTEKDLRREFERYGPIHHMSLVCSKQTGKSRGYAFIEYEHEDDMKPIQMIKSSGRPKVQS